MASGASLLRSDLLEEVVDAAAPVRRLVIGELDGRDVAKLEVGGDAGRE